MLYQPSSNQLGTWGASTAILEQCYPSGLAVVMSTHTSLGPHYSEAPQLVSKDMTTQYIADNLWPSAIPMVTCTNDH